MKSSIIWLTPSVSFNNVVQSALLQQNAAGDIAAINALQSGLIDEGATVRSEDVKLIQSAIPFVDKVLAVYPLQKLRQGRTALPPNFRREISDLANAITLARMQAYDEVVLPDEREKARKLGLSSDISGFLGGGEQKSGSEDSIDSFLDANGY